MEFIWTEDFHPATTPKPPVSAAPAARPPSQAPPRPRPLSRGTPRQALTSSSSSIASTIIAVNPADALTDWRLPSDDDIWDMDDHRSPTRSLTEPAPMRPPCTPEELEHLACEFIGCAARDGPPASCATTRPVADPPRRLPPARRAPPAAVRPLRFRCIAVRPSPPSHRMAPAPMPPATASHRHHSRAAAHRTIDRSPPTSTTSSRPRR